MHTPFMSLNRSLSDPLWTALDSHPILIALSRPYIQSHALAPSAPCPQDPSKQLYQVKALHHIHCLVSHLPFPIPLSPFHSIFLLLLTYG